MRAGRLSESPDHAARRSARARVCCAPFTLLRLLTPHCTRRRGVVEDEGAQQTEEGAANAKRRSGQPGAVAHGRGRPGPTPPTHRRQHAPDESSMTSCERL